MSAATPAEFGANAHDLQVFFAPGLAADAFVGDVVTRDATGMFAFADRTKNIIRRSGENITATEIEACLVVHGSVRQVAAIAVPDNLREGNDYSVAGNALAHDLSTWCRSIARFRSQALSLQVAASPLRYHVWRIA